MKKMLKNQKAISLITLSIAVIVLVIITNVIIYNLQDNLGLERLRNMQNDIENLREKVDSYYAQYGTIPIINTEYTNIENINNVIGANDTGKFYVIDLSNLENLTLTYGEDYKEIEKQSNINNLVDIYIINEVSHNIFYVKGVTLDGETYYTDDEKDVKEVELKYIEPEGFTYVSGTKQANNLIIKRDSDGKKYTWISLDKNLDYNSLPTDINSLESPKKERFLESANTYKGYYRSDDGDVAYIYVEVSGNAWSPEYKESAVYTDTNENSVEIPAGFQVKQTISENNVNDGLVIRNAETQDCYVWVEVPKSIYKTTMSSEDYVNIEKDMQDYVSEYRESEYTDTWNEDCGISTEDEYNNLKNKMLKSVYENGGFWISQYEIGTEEARADESDDLMQAVSREGAYPYSGVTCAQAQGLATSMQKPDEKTTSLLFGIQWDLVMKFIEEKGEKTQEELKSDSTSWGDYSGCSFNIIKGEYYLTQWNLIADDDYYTITGRLITTGATKRNSALNIYDLAGNVSEWTLERYDNNVSRGGIYYFAGNMNVSKRASYADNSGFVGSGFRVALY